MSGNIHKRRHGELVEVLDSPSCPDIAGKNLLQMFPEEDEMLCTEIVV
jgi:hypothetical protein